ncbi:MAG: YigZ family protein [Treponema sp.]|nr:YigZ family protein [Treponema sp.]
MNVLSEYAVSELSVKNSRFIAEAFPVASQAEAREKLHDVKQQYKDATHVVHAFIAGLKAETSGMSDDGEPSGTAGRPVLDVLKGSGITNILLTVTRYFGGTLLGTGGLVHAYSDSAKQVLSICKSEPYVEKRKFSFSANYALYEVIKRKYEDFHISDIQEEYSSEVYATGIIWAEEHESFLSVIKDISKGKTEVSVEPCI